MFRQPIASSLSRSGAQTSDCRPSRFIHWTVKSARSCSNKETASVMRRGFFSSQTLPATSSPRRTLTAFRYSGDRLYERAMVRNSRFRSNSMIDEAEALKNEQAVWAIVSKTLSRVLFPRRSSAMLTKLLVHSCSFMD